MVAGARCKAPGPFPTRVVRRPASARRTPAVSPARPAPTTTASALMRRPPSRPADGRREDPLEDPVVQPGLSELVPVQDRLDPLPPFLDQVEQPAVGSLAGDLLHLVQ